jgi:hypothetical protein
LGLSSVTLPERAAQQFSYERSSQAQSLTRPPILLSAAGYIDSRRMAFQLIEKEPFINRCR